MKILVLMAALLVGLPALSEIEYMARKSEIQIGDTLTIGQAVDISTETPDNFFVDGERSFSLHENSKTREMGKRLMTQFCKVSSISEVSRALIPRDQSLKVVRKFRDESDIPTLWLEGNGYAISVQCGFVDTECRYANRCLAPIVCHEATCPYTADGNGRIQFPTHGDYMNTIGAITQPRSFNPESTVPRTSLKLVTVNGKLKLISNSSPSTSTNQSTNPPQVE